MNTLADEMNELQLRFIEANRSLAVAIAVQVWKTAPHSLELDELISLANLGLVLAARRWPAYCQERGFRQEEPSYFTAFASRRMKGAVRDHLRSADWATRSTRDRAKLLNDAGRDSGASEEQLAQRTGLSVDEVRHTVAALARRPVSIDAGDRDYESATTVEQSLLERTVCQAVVSSVRAMSEVHQTVLALHYFAEVELQEIARSLGITDSQASRLHTEAVLEVHARVKDVVESMGSK